MVWYIFVTYFLSLKYLTMKKIFILLLFVLNAIDIYSQNVIPGGDEMIKIKGFISATAFLQDQNFKFANGQNAEWVNSDFSSGKWIKGFDIRNTRMTFVFNGPDLKRKWKVGGVLEIDLFGGYNGVSVVSEQQPLFRLRLAYMDFIHGRLRLRFGQAWTPMFGTVPVSLTHVAFPLGYGSAGFIGWRFPGIYSYYGLNADDSAVKIRLDAALFNGAWSGPDNVNNYGTAGNFGLPQFETKLNFISKIWSVYVVGHYDRKNLAGGEIADNKYLDGIAFELGGQIKVKRILLKGNGYYGKNIGQQLGAMVQVQPGSTDLSSVGGWFQLGYELTENWGIYGFYGYENIDKDQALVAFENPRTKHKLMCFSVKYSVGPIGLAIEYLNSNLISGKDDKKTVGNQISLSGMYKF